jgi:hypothetical protein
MDRVARALGLGGLAEGDDELRPNAAENIMQGQTTGAIAADDES